MKKTLIALALLIPAVVSAQTAFSPVGQLYLNLGSPTGIRIDPLFYEAGYGTQNYVSTLTNILDGWIISPDLRQPPYNAICPNSDPKAVIVTIKAKVVGGVTWSPYKSLSSMQIAIASPSNPTQNNEIVHAFAEKEAGEAGKTPEEVNVKTAPVGLVNGRFSMYRNVMVSPYSLVNIAVYLTGYYC